MIKINSSKSTTTSLDKYSFAYFDITVNAKGYDGSSTSTCILRCIAKALDLFISLLLSHTFTDNFLARYHG